MAGWVLPKPCMRAWAASHGPPSFCALWVDLWEVSLRFHTLTRSELAGYSPHARSEPVRLQARGFFVAMPFPWSALGLPKLHSPRNIVSQL